MLILKDLNGIVEKHFTAGLASQPERQETGRNLPMTWQGDSLASPGVGESLASAESLVDLGTLRIYILISELEG